MSTQSASSIGFGNAVSAAVPQGSEPSEQPPILNAPPFFISDLVEKVSGDRGDGSEERGSLGGAATVVAGGGGFDGWLEGFPVTSAVARAVRGVDQRLAAFRAGQASCVRTAGDAEVVEGSSRRASGAYGCRGGHAVIHAIARGDTGCASQGHSPVRQQAQSHKGADETGARSMDGEILQRARQ